MRFVTETRLKTIEELIQLIPRLDDRSYALHLLNAIREDINVNYAEIQRPIGLSGMMGRANDKRSENEHAPAATNERNSMIPLKKD